MFEVATCSECGAMLADTWGRMAHEQYHQKLDDLMARMKKEDHDG